VTADELGALVAVLACDRRRFTLEDAAYESDSDNNGAGDGAWVAYLYDAGAARTYRVADYPALRAHLDHDATALPKEWAVPLSRPARNGGRDYSEEEAHITLTDLGRILALDGASTTAAEPGTRLRALHVRYADDGDDRYRVVAHDGVAGDIEVTAFAAYADLRATTRPLTAGRGCQGAGVSVRSPRVYAGRRPAAPRIRAGRRARRGHGDGAPSRSAPGGRTDARSG